MKRRHSLLAVFAVSCASADPGAGEQRQSIDVLLGHELRRNGSHPIGES